METHSGVITSPVFSSITDIVFDRKTDSLSFKSVNNKGKVVVAREFLLGNKKVTIGDNKTVLLDGVVQSGSLVQVFEDNQGVIIAEDTSLRCITALGEKVFT